MTIKILVSDWLGKRKMTQKQLSELTGIRPATISALYHDKAKRLEIEQLDKICEAFECQPGDLFEFVKNKKDSQ